MAKKGSATKGMVPTHRTGMKKKELEQGGGKMGDTAYIKKGGTLPVQFLQTPDEFLVYQEHSWQEDGKWHFVPCLGEDCPLCEDESDDRRKRGYQWACNVFNHQLKKVQVFKGGKDLGNRIYTKHEKKPTMFTKRVWEVTKFATSPITFEVGISEDDKPIDVSEQKLIDLEEWLTKEVSDFYGEDEPTASSLDENEDEGADCPGCGKPLDEDGDCVNPKCDYDPNDANNSEDNTCPECGEELDEDGDCTNADCEAFEGEPEPEPEKTPAQKKKEAAAKKKAAAAKR